MTALELLKTNPKEFIVVYKFWFNNGLYLKKRVHVTEDNIEKYFPVDVFVNSIKTAFQEDVNGCFVVNQFVVKVSELIAFDIDFEEIAHGSEEV
jgi:hypothetical protein